MVVGLQTVQELVKDLGERDKNNPEGAGVDLRLGEVHRISGGQAFIEADGAAGQGRRSGFQTELVMQYKTGSDDQDNLEIKPGEYYLVKTIESVDIPLDMLADCRTRTSLFRAGLALFAGVGSPGYQGQLVFGLSNLGLLPVTIQMGARICSLLFYRLEETGIAYRGQHKGGRVTPAGVERQV
jgi:deoxycytidine triphosphate deaminase